MPSMRRRSFLQLLAALSCNRAFGPGSLFAQESAESLPRGTYRPGRIENEYSALTPEEREALKSVPRVSALAADELTATLGDRPSHMRIGDIIDGWRLVTITPVDGAGAAVFEKVTNHRGAIVYLSETKGLLAHIPKYVGKLSNVRPRQINTPHGVRFERVSHPGPDALGQYILNSTEDPCYENVAALGPEYVGWTLVANEESTPQRCLYLDEVGRSRELAEDKDAEGAWAPDAVGAAFDPANLMLWSPGETWSKRTLLGGYLPVADIGVWNPANQAGYEVMALLPPGKDRKPLARIRQAATEDQIREFDSLTEQNPTAAQGITITKEGTQKYFEQTWNGTPQDFYSELAGIWRRWQRLHDGRMHVEIPDEWLLNSARAGITLCRCSYAGLEPTYQIGEGAYTKVPPSSHALFPVAHYEFVWAQQLWNQTSEADAYFQHYLEHYILPSGDFVYNTQDQVEAPLNVGIFLANSARSFHYSLDLATFEKRLPILERMIGFVLTRYEHSKSVFQQDDRRYGLIWGSPEADLGDPHKDLPDSHPYYYQNAAWVCRGLEEHARALEQAGRLSGRKDFADAASKHGTVARKMREEIHVSMEATLASCSSEMKKAMITPFTTDDTNHDPARLESYENHRFMEDWFLADWGEPELDLGHWNHRQLAHRQILGMGTSGDPSITSNFMAHGTLSYLIRQDDYRPFLLTLYALACYAADSGNRYAPEDASIPGGHPLEGSSYAWSAVVNSTLQTTLGLRWLLCYEENNRDVCHLQKAVPKHWFRKGQVISVKSCPTRFGQISWSTRALEDRRWEIKIDIPTSFSADLVIHVHPDDGKALRSSSAGTVDANKIVLDKSSLSNTRELQIIVT